MSVTCLEKYHSLALLIKNDEDYDPPEVVEANCDLANDPYQINRDLLLDAHKERREDPGPHKGLAIHNCFPPQQT